MRFSLYFVLCSLMVVLLHASTTHNTSSITYYFIENTAKKENLNYLTGLWPAVKNGSQEALLALVNIAEKQKNRYWLTKSARLNSVEAQIALANISDKAEMEYWWRQAANNGHAQSQFELSLLVDTTEQRIRYLEQAALNQHTPAIIALGKYYYEENDIDNALRWLRKAAKFDTESEFKLARMQWQKGLHGEATKSFQNAAKTLSKAEIYSSTIGTIKPQKWHTLANQSTSNDLSTANLKNTCAHVIQFVATSLDSAVQAKEFKAMFDKDKRLKGLPICIKPVKWLLPNQIQCEINNDRQTCNLRTLASKAFTPDYTHLVFFLESGKAYVYNGIMYLDKADTYSVFVHELAHFSGFVDEYAVSSELAQHYCQYSQAPNLLLASADTIYEHEGYKVWQAFVSDNMQQNTVNSPPLADESLTQESVLQIAKSRTCLKVGVDAYKPSARMTFMEFHDTHFIPAIYVKMWQQQLTESHHNYAVADAFLAAAKKANAVQAEQHWQSLNF